MLTIINQSSRKLIAAFFLIVLMVSCDSKRVFDEYNAINKEGWGINTPITFQFAVNDTLAEKNLFINIRNNKDYQFSNLFLITKMQFPDGQSMVDTLEYDMADNTGKFLGKGISDIKESKLFYKENIVFPATGAYSLAIFQAMRKSGEVDGISGLQGITDVGFRIEKTK